MKWKAFLTLFLLCAGCTFKIIIPNNFKTEHTFHIKMDYPAGIPFLMDTTTKLIPENPSDTTNPFEIFLLENAKRDTL